MGCFYIGNFRFKFYWGSLKNYPHLEFRNKQKCWYFEQISQYGIGWQWFNKPTYFIGFTNLGLRRNNKENK